MDSAARTLLFAILTAASVLLIAGCESTVKPDGEPVSSANLLRQPEQGPEYFGQVGSVDGATVTRSGNSARVSRDGNAPNTISTSTARTAPPAGATATTAPAPRVAAPAQPVQPRQTTVPQQAPQPLPRASNSEFSSGFTTTATGLRYKQTVPGTGDTPSRGQTVLARYSGWIYEDGGKGDLFDRSGERPFTFVMGAGQVILGWEEAFATMRPGEKRTLIIPSELAYGRTGAPGLIRPNETLIFEVELVGVQ
jgi:peptidylprolyl isomerase